MTSTIQHVLTIAVTVSDQDAALRFYRDLLGFEVRRDAALTPSFRWIEVAPPGAAVTVALTAGDRAPGETGIRFAVGDAAAAREALGGAGVVVGELLCWDDVPPMFTIDDPDGNQFVLVELAG